MMSLFKPRFLVRRILALSVLLLPVSLAEADQGRRGKNIVETAVAAGQFKTLATALEKAGLVDALQGDGPFTVFAPTDAAFAKLPQGTLQTLLKPENKSLLVAILTYHVAPGKYDSHHLVDRSVVKTLNGQQLDLKHKNNSLTVDKARVVKADISCTNGIVHVLDEVLLPSTEDIVTTAVKAGQFKTLAAALKAAGLVEALQGKGPFTVFAPTDEAFSKLPEGTVSSLLKPENKDKLVAILKYHVVSGRKFAADVVGLRSIETLQGSQVTVKKMQGGVFLNNSRLLKTDIDASNGVIHVIDTVLLPKMEETAANPTKIIEDAIHRGVPLFNDGHPHACMTIYKKTVQQLMTMKGLTGDHHAVLRRAMANLEHTHDARSQAWILRRALDHVYQTMPPLESRNQ